MDPSLTFLAVGVAVGSTEAAQLKAGKGFTMRPVIGGFILGASLLTVGAVNPGLGSAFAGLVIVASLLVNGDALFDLASTVTAKPVTAATKKKG